MGASDFWQDQNRAKSVGQRYEVLKQEYENWNVLKNETLELLQLASMIDKDDRAEMAELEKKSDELNTRFRKLEMVVLFSGEHDKSNVILSVHAGTGGTDAQDWASMLLRMYLRFCERHGFKTEILDESLGAEAGFKSVMISVAGHQAYGWLKSENGVHRLVRISPFDAEKMRHTSFALVEVLPEPDETQEIELKDDDLRVDVMRAGGHGGQSVNTTDSAVRLTHLPTGIVVKCQNERSQLQNKTKALKILKAKLLKFYEQKESDKVKAIKGEYQKAEWGSQARSYVLQPYKLVKDHRTDYETQEVERILDGEFDDFVEDYLKNKIKE